ncbi:MAG: carboxypeptidase, partial [Synechocystis sp.]|nr:carboxypeptidase [Synechocystis sp.]
VELWDAPTAAGIKKEDLIAWFYWHPPEDDYQLMQWNDRELNGDGFVHWQPFDHPQLGPVEIGGWRFKTMWQNAPAQFLPELCEKQFRFALAHALMSPRLAVAKTDVIPQGSWLYKIIVQWENQGFLPTYTSQQALDRKAVKAIAVGVELSAGVTLITGKIRQELPHLEGRSNKAKASRANGIDYRRHLEWVVQGSPGATLVITAIAERAGTVRTEIKLS